MHSLGHSVLTVSKIEDTVAFYTKELGIAVEQRSVARTGAMGPLKSIYVRDADCNLIEVSVPT